MATAFETRNPLPGDVRERLVAELNAVMVDLLDLHYQTLLAHWNVRGESFIALHRLFDELAGCNGADNWCDWVAERIAQLGGNVVTTVHRIAAESRLPEYPVDIASAEDHVDRLAAAYVLIVERFRDAARAAVDAGDTVTGDVCTQVQRGAEKHLWLLEAHNWRADRRA
jgi:starvation-inducible DNA-binding protein